MSDNHKNEQRGLVQSVSGGISTRSTNLVRRGLSQLVKREPRVVSFPEDCSVGTLYTVNDSIEIWEKKRWEEIGKAFGDVLIPPGKKLILDAKKRKYEYAIKSEDNGHSQECNHFFDSFPITIPRPNDLQGLELGYSLNWLPAKNGMSEGIEPIERLTGLEWLSLSETSIDNLLFLENLTQLRGLEIWGTNICRLAPLHKLTNLRYLSLQVTEFFDLEYFEGLVNLEILHIHMNEDLFELAGWYPAFDVELECLKGLKKLRLLDLRGLNIGGSVEAIREELDLPNCEIWI